MPLIAGRHGRARKEPGRSDQTPEAMCQDGTPQPADQCHGRANISQGPQRHAQGTDSWREIILFLKTKTVSLTGGGVQSTNNCVI